MFALTTLVKSMAPTIEKTLMGKIKRGTDFSSQFNESVMEFYLDIKYNWTFPTRN